MQPVACFSFLLDLRLHEVKVVRFLPLLQWLIRAEQLLCAQWRNPASGGSFTHSSGQEGRSHMSVCVQSYQGAELGHKWFVFSLVLKLIITRPIILFKTQRLSCCSVEIHAHVYCNGICNSLVWNQPSYGWRDKESVVQHPWIHTSTDTWTHTYTQRQTKTQYCFVLKKKNHHLQENWGNQGSS